MRSDERIPVYWVAYETVDGVGRVTAATLSEEKAQRELDNLAKMGWFAKGAVNSTRMTLFEMRRDGISFLP